VRLDASGLRYYYPPALPCDLNRGFETFRQLDDTNDDHLDGLLEAMMAHEKEKGSKTEIDFLTWRGMMTKVCQYRSIQSCAYAVGTDHGGAIFEAG
jgi:RAT1-interacting protein